MMCMITLETLFEGKLCNEIQKRQLHFIGYDIAIDEIPICLAIDYISERYNLRIEAFLTNVWSKYSTYTIRVSSPDGGNISKNTTHSNYYKALSEALDMGLTLI